MDFEHGFYFDVGRIHIAHEFKLDAQHKCEYPHGRGVYGLVFGLTGEAEYRFSSGEVCVLRANEALLLSKNAAYSIHIPDEFRHYTVNFEVREDSSLLPFGTKNYVLSADISPEHVKQLLRTLIDLHRSQKNEQEMHAMACLYELLSMLCMQLSGQKANEKAYHRLLPAKEYIEKNCFSSFCLEELSRLSFMSLTNFRREFTRVYGESPMRYRDRLRIFYAKEYLKSGYYTAAEVSAMCGFDDPAYFGRFFKKHTGTSPGEFKSRR